MVTKEKIGTHDGQFHADEIFAIAALRLLLEYEDAEVIRSRNQSDLVHCGVLVDVGMIYEPSLRWFDHHQPGGAGERENGIPYASFGLIWRHYGKKICKGSTDVASIVEQRLVWPIDATDNGRSIYKVRNKDLRPYTLSSVIATLNSRRNGWWLALELARELLLSEIGRARDELRAKKVVREVVRNSADKRMLLMPSACRWKEVISIEAPDTLFIVQPIGKIGRWAVQAAPDPTNPQNPRFFFPKEWAGLREGQLEEVVGLSDLIFCHNNRHLLVAAHRSAALQVAELVLSQHAFEDSVQLIVSDDEETNSAENEARERARAVLDRFRRDVV